MSCPPAIVRDVRVAVFTDNDFRKVNGVTTTLRALLAHAPADIRPRIYTCEPRDVDRPGYYAAGTLGVGLPFHREIRMYWPPIGRIVRQARLDRIDLIHLTTLGPVGLAALYAATKLGIAMVGSVHTDLAEHARFISGSTGFGQLTAQYMRWPYGRCRRILVPSAATRETLIRSRIDPAKIGSWRRGVSTEQFSPHRRSAALRARWGASDQRPVLMYVGRVSREKGLDLLPALTERLQRSGVKHRLVVVGDGPMRSELSDRCTGAVFTGRLSHDDVAIALASADVFVFPSQTDTAGTAVLEAQASGVPVLVTDKGGPAENMADERTGYICQNARAFAGHATALLGSPHRRRHLSVQARLYAEGRPWSTALDALYRAYREAVEPDGVDAPVGLGPVLATEPVA